MHGTALPDRRREPSRGLIADGSGHDRQTLVVGEDPAALATAGFLEQAGLDPVLAAGPAATSAPAAVTLWQPGLSLLERLGLRRPVEAVGTELTALECVEPAQSWTGGTSDRPPLIAVRRDRLESVLWRHLGDRFRTTDRSLVSVEPTDAGVRVTFEGGIDETFDAVATTGRALLPDDDTPTASVHWWSFDWPDGVPAPTDPTEAWGRDCAAFVTPVGGSARVDLVATGGTASAAPLSFDALDEQFGGFSTPLADALGALHRSSLQYRQTSCAIPGALRVDGIAPVGPAAHASVPGGCLGPALAIEDGWVLADVLAYGPATVEDALGAYADRRQRRLTDVSSALREERLLARVPTDLTGLIGQLCARRTLAFGHLFDAPAEELLRDVPDRL